MVDKTKRKPLRPIDIRIGIADYRRRWLLQMAADDDIPPQALVRQLIAEEWRRRRDKDVVQSNPETR